jgi:hypothetical protein
LTTVKPALEKQLVRLYETHSKRVLALSTKLRSTAGELEDLLVRDFSSTKGSR